MEKKEKILSLQYVGGRKNIAVFISTIKDMLAFDNAIRTENSAKETVSDTEKSIRLKKIKKLKKKLSPLVKNKKKEIFLIGKKVEVGQLEELRILIRRKNITIDSLTEFLDLNIDLEFYTKKSKRKIVIT